MRLDADAAWGVVSGAEAGSHWYVDALPFVVRGALDRVVGGGGRKWPVPGKATLERGDTAGFWRVVRVRDGARTRVLELEAAVRGPGRVTLETSVVADGPERCTVSQTVTFDPDGLVGQLFMLADLPAREVVVELAHRRLLAELDAAA